MLEYQATLDRAFQALAEPNRRALYERLARGPATVSELARPFDLTLAAVLQHVQVLEASGLIVTEKIGRSRTCRAAPEAIDRIERWLDERRRSWEGHFDRLGALVEGDERFGEEKTR